MEGKEIRWNLLERLEKGRSRDPGRGRAYFFSPWRHMSTFGS